MPFCNYRAFTHYILTALIDWNRSKLLRCTQFVFHLYILSGEMKFIWKKTLGKNSKVATTIYLMINYFAIFHINFSSLWSSGHFGSDQRSMQTTIFFSVLAKESQEKTIRQNQAFPKTYSQSPKNVAQQAPETAVLSWCLLKILFIYELHFLGIRWLECSPWGITPK